MGSEASLKAISYRLTSTPAITLPAILPSLQSSLIECRGFLQSPKAQTKNTTDNIVIERFRKLLTTFLTDTKNIQRRWTAAVLIKATIDVGGPPTLQESAAWIRGLLSILTKWQDPPTTKRIAILALTKIFTQTHEYPSLVRELTTPNLPSFISPCLQNVVFKTGAKPNAQQLKTQRSLMAVVLQVFAELLPRHPTIFRSFEKQLRELLLPLLAPTPSSSLKKSQSDSNLPAETQVQHAAQSLFALLHFTAPKNGGPEEWNNTITAVVSDIHATADQTFRSLVEDWRSSTGVMSTLDPTKSLESQPGQKKSTDSRISLPPWEGVYAGSERLKGLLALLEAFIASETSGQVFIPIARIEDLITRLLLITSPNARDPEKNLKPNDNCSREEREALWSTLSSLHVAVLQTTQAFAERFEHALMPVALLMLDHVQWVIRRESFSSAVRQGGYTTTTQLLQICGRGLTTQQVRTLSEVIKLACRDIVRDIPSTTSNGCQPNGTQNGLNTIITVEKKEGSPITTNASPLKDSAITLLTTFLTHILPSQTPTALRTLVDRTVILSGDQDAMMASVINPPHSTSSAGGKVRSSILPFLARQHGTSNDVEALVRPRLPVVLTETVAKGAEQADEEPQEDEEMADVDAEDEDVHRLDSEPDDQHLSGQERRGSLSRSPTMPAQAEPSPSDQSHNTSANDDTVIQTLAYRARDDPQLKHLIRVVAAGSADKAQLDRFQEAMAAIRLKLQAKRVARQACVLMDHLPHEDEDLSRASKHRPRCSGKNTRNDHDHKLEGLGRKRSLDDRSPRNSRHDDPSEPTAKRTRIFPPHPDLVDRVQPTDELVTPAAPVAVPVVAQTDEGAQEMVVESAADALPSAKNTEASVQEQNPARNDDEEDRLQDGPDGEDSESEMSLPELQFNDDDEDDEAPAVQE